MHDRLGSRLHAEFAEDGVDVELDGVVADAEALGDLFVGEPAGKELQHFELAMRERLLELDFRTAVRRRGTRDHLIENRKTVGDRVQRGFDLQRAGGAHQETADARALQRRRFAGIREQHHRRHVQLARDVGDFFRFAAAVDHDCIGRGDANARPQVVVDREVAHDVQRRHRLEHREQSGPSERIAARDDDAQRDRPLLKRSSDGSEARVGDAHSLLDITIAYSAIRGYHPRALNVLPTDLTGVLLLEPKVFADARGFFLETYNAARFRDIGIEYAFVQDNHSRSSRGVLRGLHYQEPKPQGKLVRCTRGTLFDVAVDIRVGSPQFGRWFGAELSEENQRMLWIPPGFAHGFCPLTDVADLMYKCTELYDAASDRAIAWNDPQIGIRWPIADPILSAKDAAAPTLHDAKVLPSFR